MATNCRSSQSKQPRYAGIVESSLCGSGCGASSKQRQGIADAAGIYERLPIALHRQMLLPREKLPKFLCRSLIAIALRFWIGSKRQSRLLPSKNPHRTRRSGTVVKKSFSSTERFSIFRHFYSVLLKDCLFVDIFIQDY